MSFPSYPQDPRFVPKPKGDSVTRDERLVEVERLRALGMDTVPTLLALLEHPRQRVRLLAARELAADGDDRALPALCRELRTYAHISAPQHVVLWRMAGNFVKYLGQMAAAALLRLTVELWSQGRTRPLPEQWADTLADLRGHNAYVSELLHAIAEIACRSATPEARAALTLLRRMTVDPALAASTRSQAGYALQRIESATAWSQSLPVVESRGTRGTDEEDRLPIPASLR